MVEKTLQLEPRRRHWWKLLPLLCIILAAGGALGYYLLFARESAAAASLIPSDAPMVITVDLVRNPGQVRLLRGIRDSMLREGLGKEIDKLVQKSPGYTVEQKIGSHLKPAFAAGLWLTGSKNNPDFIMSVPMKDPAKVREILEQNGQKGTLGSLEYYRLASGRCHALIGDCLASSNKPELLARAAAVYQGKTPAVTTLSSYKAAMAALPGDTNLAVFMLPDALTKSMPADQQLPEQNPFKGIQYMAFGAALRDDGIAIEGWMSGAGSADTPFAALAGAKPLPPSFLAQLPAGAYGFSCQSQAGAIWKWERQQLARASQDTDARITQGETAAGISIVNDVAPALNGNCTVAVYPDERGPDHGVELTAIMDDTNNADPAALFARLRALIEKSTVQSPLPVRFESQASGRATIWSMNPEAVNAIRAGLTGIISQRLIGSPEGAQGALTYFDNKEIIYGQVGKAVILTTSRGMLQKALAAYTGADQSASLSTQQAYRNMSGSVIPGAQSVFMLDTHGILEALRPMLEQEAQKEHSTVTVNDLIQVFPISSGLVTSTRVDRTSALSQCFIPVNYDRAIHFATSVLKEETRRRSENQNIQPNLSSGQPWAPSQPWIGGPFQPGQPGTSGI